MENIINLKKPTESKLGFFARYLLYSENSVLKIITDDSCLSHDDLIKAHNLSKNKVCGGGMIVRYENEDTVHFFGCSIKYGQANHKKAIELCSQAFHTLFGGNCKILC